MEENQLENQKLDSANSEPENFSENSERTEKSDSTLSNKAEGESNIDPSELILGKFKSQDDLVKAYQNLEKLQGTQAEELGTLRKNSATWNDTMKLIEKTCQIQGNPKTIVDAVEKYDAPEYFQDSAFRLLFREAYKAFGTDVNTDYFVKLLDEYVSNRIDAYEKKKSAEAETQKVLGSMNFTKSEKTSIQKPKKRLDEMTKQEIDEMLSQYI